MSENVGSNNIVEVLENGDVMFEGRLVSPAELLVGTVLCGLNKVSDEGEAVDNGEINRTVSNEPATGGDDELSSSASLKRRKLVMDTITLPEDDVRLTLAKTYVDALNTADNAVVLKMLRELTAPNFVMVNRKLTPDPEFIMPQHFEIIGAETYAAITAQFYIATPDIVIKILNQAINVYTNGEAMIELDVVCHATKIFELEGMPEGEGRKMILSSHSAVDALGEKLGGVQLTSRIQEDEKQSKEVPITVGAAKVSKKHTVRSKMALHVNANNKIFLVIATYD